MGKLGYGYGSEWHLLRLLGRHRSHLDREVLRACKGESVKWLDFPYAEHERWQDAEWKGLDFLPANSPVREVWSEYWPQCGNVHNWDAVARIEVAGSSDWLLVEAKAHPGELKSSCGAVSKRSYDRISAIMSETKAELGAPAGADWMHGYYQYCNRLAVLRFMVKHGIPARLLFLYLVGDWPGRSGSRPPQKADGWVKAIQAQASHLALPKAHILSARIHSLVLDVRG